MSKATKIDLSDYDDGLLGPRWLVSLNWRLLDGKPRSVGVLGRKGKHWANLIVDPAREWIMDHPKSLGKVQH